MPNTSAHHPRRPVTVGILLATLGDAYQWEVLQGALDATRDRGAHLLCFESGLFHAADAFAGAGGMLSLIGPQGVDGLVVLAGALGNEVGADVIRIICERFQPIPMCFVAVDVPGVSSVNVDNHLGGREVLGHLVVHHGMRRVAFVRGPEANAEAERRFAAYRDVLAGASVPFDPALVAPGDFTTESGRRAVSLLLDDRARQVGDLEAIACANDSMALGALEALERRGIRVPEQLALVGFDDVQRSRFTSPPLTTVRQPLRQQGREAVRMVLAPEAGVEKIVLGTELRVRRSCGCFSRRGPAAPASQPSGLSMEAMLVSRRDMVVADLARAARGAFSPAGPGWEARLVSAFLGELAGPLRDAVPAGMPLPVGIPGTGSVRPAGPMGFVETYDDILRRLVAAGIDPAICYDVVATLRRHLLRCVGTDRRERALTEGLLEQISELTGTVMERVQAWQRIDVERRARAFGLTGAAVTRALEHGDVARAFGEYLTALGVESCYLVSVERSAIDARGSARLLLAHDAGTRATWRPEASTYPVEEILPYAFMMGEAQTARRTVLMAAGRETAYVVSEIRSQRGDLALLIVDLGQAEGYAYEALRHLFASALEGARLTEMLGAERRANAVLTADLADMRKRAAAVHAALTAAVERRRPSPGTRGSLDRELEVLEATLESARAELEKLAEPPHTNSSRRLSRG
jgi:LacI family transcriptional regulator